MKVFSKIIIGVVVAGLVMISILVIPGYLRQPSKQMASRPPAPTPSPALDPLQIEAMRARSYPSSPLTVSKDLGEQGGYSETVSSFQSDGLTEDALVSTPDGPKPAAGWPVVILAHGYINPASYQTDGPNYAGIISGLARSGFLVIKPDYRGHGNSQGQPAGGHYSPVYAYDILNLISAVKHYSPADPARIGLLGHSMGGHEALRTIVVSKDVKATVFMAGVVGSMTDLMYNWPHSPLLRDQPSSLVQSARQGLLAKYGTPAANPAFWNSASAINYVSDIAGPVQIHQSVGDRIVPRSFSDHLDQALTDAHKPVEYYVYPGDDHQLAAPKTRTLMMQRIIAFYRTHL